MIFGFYSFLGTLYGVLPSAISGLISAVLGVYVFFGIVKMVMR